MTSRFPAPSSAQHCFKCHGEDEQKSDLNLSSFATLVKGGAAAARCLVAGRPVAASRLFEAITRDDPAARMPPNSPPLAAEKIELIRAWIEQGLRENSGSKSLAARRRSDISTRLTDAASDGWPARRRCPKNLPAIEIDRATRPDPCCRGCPGRQPLGSPLLAVAGHDGIFGLFDPGRRGRRSDVLAVSRGRAVRTAFQPRRQGAAGRRRKARCKSGKPPCCSTSVSGRRLAEAWATRSTPCSVPI